MTEFDLLNYPIRSMDKIRYGDTDRQGHVNNAVFATYLETGRVDLLQGIIRPLLDDTTSFVIARLQVDFRAEIHWPGEVHIGTRVASIGNSSIRLQQVIFQGTACVATGESVVVIVDLTTRKSTPLPLPARDKLNDFIPKA